MYAYYVCMSGTIDNFTAKVWIMFKDDFECCARTSTVPANLHTFISDLNSQWVVDSQYVEGVNGVLKRIVTQCPGISLPLLSARTSMRRMLAGEGSDTRVTPADRARQWAGYNDIITQCAARHNDPEFRARLEQAISDNDRWAVLDPAEVPLDDYAPPPAPVHLSTAQRQQARRKDIDEHFAAAMLCALKDVFDGRGTPWLPSAQVALEIIWVYGDGAGDDEDVRVEYWIAALTYYSQLWMVKGEFEVSICIAICMNICMNPIHACTTICLSVI